ncbi:MAG: PAS domain-containing protein [Actinomycetota bacterium]
MIERSIKSLVLIRAKNLAESVATPMLLIDAVGNLIFYNEGAESLLGTPFTDVGNLPASEWQDRFRIRARDDKPAPLEQMPGWIDLQGERPGLGHVRITTLDGTDLFIAVCAVPLFTAQRQFDGALVLFWEEREG